MTPIRVQRTCTQYRGIHTHGHAWTGARPAEVAVIPREFPSTTRRRWRCEPGILWRNITTGCISCALITPAIPDSYRLLYTVTDARTGMNRRDPCTNACTAQNPTRTIRPIRTIRRTAGAPGRLFSRFGSVRLHRLNTRSGGETGVGSPS